MQYNLRIPADLLFNNLHVKPYIISTFSPYDILINYWFNLVKFTGRY